MARVKMLLVCAVPVLWLVASVDCLADLVSLAPHTSIACAFCSEHGAHRESSISVCPFEQSARRLGRRLDIESGPEKFHPQAAAFGCYDSPLAQPAFASAHFQPALELIQSWQFLWRTAAEPRAPSSVS